MEALMSELGIPVYRNGNPVRFTILVAANLHHASNWAGYSRVNLRSRRLLIADKWNLRGLNDFDVVYYGPWFNHRDYPQLEQILGYLLATRRSPDCKVYEQYEAYEIEANVVPYV
jgi:hypothetical protein